MTTDKHYKYFAFISYKREDEKWAQWLQCKLENYKLPTTARQNNPSLPDKVRPIFRDTTDLSGGVLERAINNALSDSRFLIVICSPRAAKSQWVCKEVQTFIDSGREENIIPFIIEGQPYSHDISTECYPAALKELSGSRELLGININEMGRDAAAVKAVARMFELPFDTLWQRFRRDARKKRRIFISVLMLFTLVSLITASIFWGLHRRMQSNQARAVAEKATQLTKQGDSYLAQRILLEVLPDNNDLIKRPYVAEAEKAFRDAVENNGCLIKSNQIFTALSDFTISPDEKKIITTTYSGVITIWNIYNGKCEHLSYHDGTFSSAILSSDQKYIIAVADKEIHTIDITTGECIKRVPIASTYSIFRFEWSPNGKYLAAITNHDIVIMDTDTGKSIKTLKGHKNDVYEIIFSKNNKYVLSRSEIRNIDMFEYDQIKLWEIETGKCIHTFDNYKGGDFNPNCEQIALSTKDGKTIDLWDINTKQVIKSFYGENIYSLHFDGTGKNIFYLTEGGYVGWNIINDFWYRYKDVYENEVYLCKTNSTHLFYNNSFYSERETITIFPIPSIEDNIFSIPKPHYPNAIASKDCKSILTCYDNALHLIDINSKDYINFAGHSDDIMEMDISYDNKYIVSHSRDKTIRLWDVPTGECLKVILSDTNAYIRRTIRFSPDNRFIGINNEKNILLWDIEKEKFTTTALEHLPSIRSFDFSSDGKHIISSSENSIKIWDVNNTECIHTISDDEQHKFYDAKFSPDGRYIVTGYANYPWKLYDIEKGIFIKEFTKGSNRDIKFSPNGKYIIIGDCIWDTERWECISKFDDHHFSAFSPSGDAIITIDIRESDWGHDDNHTWSIQAKLVPFLPLQKLIDNAKERFKDNPLTDEERKEYYLE